jgi:tripartite-type tricarboxylate transporter receptor subunit TctC
VADFYRGKTIRLVLGLPAGTGADTGHRLIAKYMTRYLPGNPRIIVENKPGAGGILATNLVYNVEPQDGTVISAFVESNVLQQALGAPGIEFDAGKLQWLGSAVKTTGACLARTDTGITSIQDTIAGPEVIIGVSAPGGTTHDVAAVLKAALGANFRLVMGYDGSPRLILATESKEVEGFCVSLRSMLSDAAH